MAWGIIYQLNGLSATYQGKSNLTKAEAEKAYKKLMGKEGTIFVKLFKDDRLQQQWFANNEIPF